MDKLFEIVLIVPYVSQKSEIVEGFLLNIRKEYSPSMLREINLYSWSASDTIGITLSFDFSSFLPHYLDRIESWSERLEAKFYNLMMMGEKERDVFKSKLPLTSDLKFAGDFDIPTAIKNILTRTSTTRGRKYPRYSISIKVTFKSQEQFIEEYAKDISKGGIFVATDNPLPLESKIELILSLPDFNKEIKIIGEVVHVFGSEQAKLLDNKRVSGMGVQFLEFEGDGQKVLETYFKSLSQSR
jgi:uncharacterized protein (TIGR02266 family)